MTITDSTSDGGDTAGNASAAPDQAVDDLHDTADHTGSDDAQKKPGRFRERLAAAECERDRLAGVLLAQQNVVFEGEVAAAGIKPELLRAAGMSVSDYLDHDGLIDAAALAEAIETKRLEFGLPQPSRRPAPNPVAGRGGEPPRARADLGAILQAHAHPRR